MNEASGPTPSWNGGEKRELFRLGWPIGLAMLSFGAMNMVDMVFIGTLGPEALGGVGLAGALTWTLLVFFVAVLRGVKVLVSLAVGSGKKERAEVLEASGLIIAVIAGLAVVGIGQLVVLAIPKMASSPIAAEYAAAYLAIRMLSAPMFLVRASTTEVLWGLGHSRGPMFATIAANVANTGLDYLFIIHYDGGVAGAAWASFIAVALEMVLILFVIHQVRGTHFTWPQRIRRGAASISSVLRIGIATGFQELGEVGSYTLLSIIVATMAAVELAAYQAVVTVIMLVTQPMYGFAEAASIMAGQAVGACKESLVPRVTKIGWLYGSVFALLCSAVLALAPRQVAQIFGDDPEFLDTTVSLLRLAAAELPLIALLFTVRFVLRGTGDVRFPTIAVLGANWLVLLPLAWFVGPYSGGDVWHVYLVLVGTTALLTAVLFVRVFGGGWRESAARSRALVDEMD